jgi:tripartite-type tricarboxylate transporter receptor subunit TctC
MEKRGERKIMRRKTPGRIAMKMTLRLLAALLLFALAAPAVSAQEAYPSKPIHIFVPYPAGGGVDTVTRLLGDELSKKWGQTVVVENHPGAGGTIASQMVAKAPADGYTLIVVASGHAINPYLYSKLPYDTFKDFTPISLLASSPNILLVRADSPYKTLGDVLAYARKNPGKLSYAMAGSGTSTHLAGELLKYIAKVDITAVPYKGGAPAINDLLGGHIPLSFNNAPEALGQIKGGALRALGVTPAQRSPLLPDVPTIAEAGLTGYDTGVWWGLLGPGNLPPAVTAKLSEAAAEAMKAPAVRERLTALGSTAVGNSAKEFSDIITADYKKWGPIIKAAGIKAD